MSSTSDILGPVVAEGKRGPAASRGVETTAGTLEEVFSCSFNKICMLLCARRLALEAVGGDSMCPHCECILSPT